MNDDPDAFPSLIDFLHIVLARHLLDIYEARLLRQSLHLSYALLSVLLDDRFILRVF